MAKQNALVAFEWGWRAGHGVELNVRCRDGLLYVPHDHARVRNPVTLTDVLHVWRRCGEPGLLMVNVKEDGRPESNPRVLLGNRAPAWPVPRRQRVPCGPTAAGRADLEVLRHGKALRRITPCWRMQDAVIASALSGLIIRWRAS